MMSDTQFVTAVVYTLSWIEKMGIVLKPEQVKAMHHIYQGRDVRPPTRFGKSICYKVLCFLIVAHVHTLS